jgi:hypothetical protein
LFGKHFHFRDGITIVCQKREQWESENIPPLLSFFDHGFGNAYLVCGKWKKLPKSGKFYRFISDFIYVGG